MVTQTQLPYTSLQFPPDAAVGDFWVAPTGIPYKLEPNLRWRNVIPGEPTGPTGGPGDQSGDWERSVDELGQAKELLVPHNGNSPLSSPLSLYPSGPEHIGHGDRLFDIGSLSGQMFAYNEVHVYGISVTTSKHITTLEDTGDLNFYQYMPGANGGEGFPLHGEDVASDAWSINSFNKGQHYFITLNLADYITDLSRVDECSYMFSVNNSNYQRITTNGVALETKQYDYFDPWINYTGVGGAALSTNSSDWSFPTNTGDAPQRWVNNGWEQLLPGALYVAIEFVASSGQRHGGWRVDIRDPYANAAIEDRVFTGFYKTRKGDQLYTNRDSIPLPQSVNYGLPIIDDLEDYSFDEEVEVYHDYGALPGAGEVTPLGLYLENHEMLICDGGDFLVKQWKLRYENSFVGMTDMQWWAWEYTDYYKTFLTVAAPLDVQLNSDKDMMFVLEADNVIRRYSITGRDISTAVLVDSISVDTATDAATHFFLTQTETSIMIPHIGGFRTVWVDPNDLTDFTWASESTVLDVDVPMGISLSGDGQTLLVGEVHRDTSVPMKIIQYNKKE